MGLQNWTQLGDWTTAMISKVEHIFIYLFVICISSLEIFLSHLVSWLFSQYNCLLFFFFLSSLYILGINPVSDIVCKYFLPFQRLSYHFVDCFFCCEEALRLEVVPLVHFWFWCLWFRCHIQKSLSRPMSRCYYPFVSF